MTRAKIQLGILLSLLLAIPLVGIIYIAEKGADLPFVPTDLMDWLIPIIPADMITFGIDIMVDVITGLNLGRVDTTAKFAEGAMAIAIFVGVLTLVGTAYYAILHERVKQSLGKLPSFAGGLLLGIGVGVVLAIISDHTLTSDNPFFDGPSLAARSTWIIILLAGWGVAMQYVFNQWSELPAENHASVDVFVDESAKMESEGVAASFPVEKPALSPVIQQAILETLNRRQFLIRLGGATAVITVVGAGLGRLFIKDEKVVALDTEFSFLNFPNKNSRVLPASGTRPEYTPIDQHYRIDINSGGPPEIDGDSWHLVFKGLVNTETEMTLQDLQNNYTPMHQYVTLACISNRIGGNLTSTTGWTGASLRDVLQDVGLKPDATHLKISSADGFWEIVDLELVRSEPRIMLAYAWNSELLRVKHGFPLRIYIPDHFGMKQPKWITEIEATSEWEPGYWVIRGWDRDAIMRTTSVIDTVAVDSVYEQDGQRFVPMGGIAHAGARGISKVEVQVDEGEWVEAELRQPLSTTTWVIWRYDWPFEDGDHTFAVRCYESNGEMQITERANPHPSGATGIHTRSANL